jgi:hypothetical protein
MSPTSIISRDHCAGLLGPSPDSEIFQEDWCGRLTSSNCCGFISEDLVHQHVDAVRDNSDLELNDRNKSDFQGLEL